MALHYIMLASPARLARREKRPKHITLHGVTLHYARLAREEPSRAHYTMLHRITLASPARSVPSRAAACIRNAPNAISLCHIAVRRGTIVVERGGRSSQRFERRGDNEWPRS